MLIKLVLLHAIRRCITTGNKKVPLINTMFLYIINAEFFPGLLILPSLFL